MASEIPWQTVGSCGVGILALIGSIHSVVSGNRIKQTELKLKGTQDEFEREKNQRQNFVADIERCETRLDELQEAVKKWMTDYSDLNAKYLAECQAHSETRLELAQIRRRIDEIEAEKKHIEKERDTIKAEYQAYQQLVKNTATAVAGA